MNDRLDIMLAQWARLGVGFNVAPAAESPDLERLLLETARLAPSMARLFIMSATWLHEYGDVIATHRLRRLIAAELEPQHRPVLGLLLDIAQRGTHPAQFASVVQRLHAEAEARPLFEIEQSSPALRARSQRRASALSKKWGLWCEDIEFKPDAIRPPLWIMTHNPGLITRADFRGDLRASILAALEHDAAAGSSELQLARASGGSRAQVRSSLANLELTGRVRRTRAPNSRSTHISLASPGRIAG